MPDTPAHRRLTRRLILELAVLAVLLLHVGFFYLFTLTTDTPAPLEDGTPETVLLSPPGTDSGWEADLRAWAYFADPSLLTLPNLTHGFSGARETQLPPPHSDYQPAGAALASQPSPARTGPPLSLPGRDMAANISNRWPELRALSPPVLEAAVLPAALVWRFADGCRITGLPEALSDELRPLASSEKPPLPSRFEVVLKPLRPGRVSLIGSCGVPALDQFAYRALTLKVAVWERLAARHEGTPELDRFAAAADATLAVEVEWRLLAAAPKG